MLHDVKDYIVVVKVRSMCWCNNNSKTLRASNRRCIEETVIVDLSMCMSHQHKHA